MTKSELLSISPEQAFSLGQQAKQSGKHESYNPYRNMDSTQTPVTELNAAWIDGCLECCHQAPLATEIA